jgi:hypothetical protein
MKSPKLLEDIRVKYILVLFWAFLYILLWGLALGIPTDWIVKMELFYCVPATIIVVLSIVFLPKRVKREQEALSKKLSKSIPLKSRLLLVLAGVSIAIGSFFLFEMGLSDFAQDILIISSALFFVYYFEKSKELQRKSCILSPDEKYNYILILGTIIAIVVMFLLFILLLKF